MDAHESGDYELVRRSWQGNDSQVWGFELVGYPNYYRISHKVNGRFLDSYECAGCRAVTRGRQDNKSQIWLHDEEGGQDRLVQDSTIHLWHKKYLTLWSDDKVEVNDGNRGDQFFDFIRYT